MATKRTYKKRIKGKIQTKESHEQAYAKIPAEVPAPGVNSIYVVTESPISMTHKALGIVQATSAEIALAQARREYGSRIFITQVEPVETIVYAKR